MAPLFFFLASSFNVELVYVILKGITSFSYIASEDLNLKQRERVQNLDFVKEDGNVTLTLKEIKIYDSDKWSQMITDKDLEEVNKDIIYDS